MVAKPSVPPAHWARPTRRDAVRPHALAGQPTAAAVVVSGTASPGRSQRRRNALYARAHEVLRPLQSELTGPESAVSCTSPPARCIRTERIHTMLDVTTRAALLAPAGGLSSSCWVGTGAHCSTGDGEGYGFEGCRSYDLLVSTARSAMRVAPRSRTLASSPCSSAWSATMPRSLVVPSSSRVVVSPPNHMDQ